MSSGRTVLDGPASSATRTVTEPTTLGDEHAALVQAVHRRADAALALIDAQVGPAAEVETLARFLHTAVLRQASDEEVLPYPHGASAPVAELTDDHVYLHELAERLDRVEV